MLIFNCFVLGWLSQKQLASGDAVFSAFECFWPNVYRYVVQCLSPRMEVDLCLFLSKLNHEHT